MTFVRIQPNLPFEMGSTPEQVDRLIQLFPDVPRALFDTEMPQHPVRITRPFFLGANEVTVSQFRKFMEATGGHTDPGINWRNPGFSQEDTHPVVCVSHNDAVAFCGG